MQNIYFYDDLEIGKSYEMLTASILQKKGLSITFNNSSDRETLKLYDLSFISKDGKTVKVEVKKDSHTDRTNNICIEYASNGNRSGIATTKADVYFYYSDTFLYLIDVRKLKLFIMNAQKTDTLNIMYANGWSRLSDNILINESILVENGIARKTKYDRPS